MKKANSTTRAVSASTNRSRSGVGRLLLAVLAGMTILFAGLEVAGSVESVVGAPTLQPPAELPREWVWQRRAVSFDGMFRGSNDRQPSRR